MSRHPMDHADAAWLRMDRPSNLMVVNSVMWFEEPLEEDRVRAVLEERLLGRFPRFRQRAVDEHGLWWEDDEDFRLDRHLHRTRLPAPAGRRELEDYVGGHMTIPLDRSRPLWELHLVENYAGGAALFFRMHHAIADGIALVRVLLSLTDDPDVEPAGVVPAQPTSEQGPGLFGTARNAVAGLTGLAGVVAHEAVTSALHPTHLLDLARTSASDARALSKLLLLPPDRRTALRGRTGPTKRVLWSDPVPLDRVKEAAHASGATVNDLLLAAVTGALRAHLERRESPVHDLRAVVPFNLRPLDEPLPAELGNRFGLVFLTLPVGTADRSARLAEMSRRMTAIKDSAEGTVAYGVLQAVGLAPPLVEQMVVDVFAAKASAVMTNVPGPRHAVTLAGHRLQGTIGWVPMSGDIGLGISIFSYAGEVTIGLCVDAGLVPHEDQLLQDTIEELHHLLASAVG